MMVTVKKSGKMRANKEILIGAVVAIVLFLIFNFLYLHLENVDKKSHFYDYNIYVTAGMRALQGLPIYEQGILDPFKYSPSAAVYFGVIFQGQYEHAWRYVYYLIAFLSWMIFISLSSRSICIPGLSWNGFDKYLVGYSLFFIFYSHPFWLEFRVGQCNGLMWCLMLSGILQLNGQYNLKSKILSSFMLGTVLQFKLYILCLFPLLFFKRQYGVLVGTLLFFFVCQILSLLPFYNWNEIPGMFFAWGNSLFYSTSIYTSAVENISLFTIVSRFWPELPLVLRLFPWLSAAILVTSLHYFYRKEHILWHFYLFSIGTILLTPSSWNYWVLFSTPLLLHLVFMSLPRLHVKKTQFKDLALISYTIPPILLLWSCNSQFGKMIGLDLLVLVFLYLLVVNRSRFVFS